MRPRRIRRIDIYALDDLVEQWVQSPPPTPEERLMISAFIANHKKKLAAAERIHAKFEAWKAGLRRKKQPNEST